MAVAYCPDPGWYKKAREGWQGLLSVQTLAQRPRLSSRCYTHRYTNIQLYTTHTHIVYFGYRTYHVIQYSVIWSDFKQNLLLERPFIVVIRRQAGGLIEQSSHPTLAVLCPLAVALITPSHVDKLLISCDREKKQFAGRRWQKDENFAGKTHKLRPICFRPWQKKYFEPNFVCE